MNFRPTKPLRCGAEYTAETIDDVVDGFDRNGYYVASVNGVTITFPSYEEYLEYIEAA